MVGSVCTPVVKWLLVLMFWTAGGKSVTLEFDNEPACHAAADRINAMLEKHLVAAGHDRDQARKLLAEDYVCIPKR
ncbi:hypothetical protein [Hyphomicrobium sp. ghe19]|uniref:hypothetical protein n=1 Tax=Hyphomicrobium sp. ghe19 TaxID=2682968 RepID=UPI001367727E|nr:hypothetical protein HYPP_02412 [Hyphomicrobium sp. ghe19]